MTRIELLHGGFLLFHDPFLTPDEASASFTALLAEVPFRQETIRLFGKSILQPRLSAWHGDPGAAYTYSGLSLKPNPWTPALSALRARVEAAAGCTFNSVLVNHYRDGDDSMGKHADDEPELGENPVIASLSLGAKRRFVLEPKKKGGEKVTLLLGEGNLLVMAGTTQHHYRHGVPKQAGLGARMNLTFRWILPAEGHG
ncbi:alpha-ketoglutarate-dependent dioxygenase AlkB [Polyangium sp. y55x31]|uniref:alpha-ketoglutarate-dependent dioxygenase AlkB family protein n=1 Tax=Polyangium sp. y55x31 TaxID=3042688 RepID=UPI00248300BF|nr:alpha-ketoglutarate-dependent dioxygenase AlkB [Polyangium sp. y55x31]MDI1477592.1 alpha-ketoglutarate-dependent dioxygenase AlkB [Polyangium sp. y55x31]